MGSCCAANLDNANHIIEEKMDAEHKIDAGTNKLLFLGPGGSGKSTIFKQLQWLYGEPDAMEDILALKQTIYSQIVWQMKKVLENYVSQQETEQEHSDELKKAIESVKNHDAAGAYTAEVGEAIQFIWQNEPNIKGVFHWQKFQTDKWLDESTEYFWNELDRINAEDYVPTSMDLLNVRDMTTGVTEKRFEFRKSKFLLVDVGGQKSERKKWINCFNEVKALIFVISLSCYNENMFEDKTKNAMEDSLELFNQTIDLPRFKKKSSILFLNKRDLFEDKIVDVPITKCPAFHDFDDWKNENYIKKDPNNYEQTSTYVIHKFKELNRHKQEKQIYTHITCAMDKNNIEHVFWDVNTTVIQGLFLKNGIA